MAGFLLPFGTPRSSPASTCPEQAACRSRQFVGRRLSTGHAPLRPAAGPDFWTARRVQWTRARARPFIDIGLAPDVSGDRMRRRTLLRLMAASGAVVAQSSWMPDLSYAARRRVDPRR